MARRLMRESQPERWIRRPGVWSGLVLGAALAGRSFRPSLMPRSTANQALVTGAAASLGFGVAEIAYTLGACTGTSAGDAGVLAAAVAGGMVVSRRLAETDDEPHWRPIVRTGASCVAAGGAVALVGVGLRGLSPRHRQIAGGALTVVAGLTGVREVVRGVKAQRAAHTEYDPPPPKPLPAVTQSAGVAAALSTVFVGVTRTSGVLARMLEHQVGVPPVASKWLGRALAVGGWAAIGKAASAYISGDLRTYDRVLDSAFDAAPTSPMRSAGPGSIVNFARLGREGRRFVLNAPTADEITEVMGRPAVAEPIRVYAGYTAGRDDEERVAVALTELRRTGAFDRRLLVVGCPAGNGLVNNLPLEVLDHLLGGDTAAVAVQYGRLPSFLTLQRTTRGGKVQRALLEAIGAELADRPADQRPTVVVYGESLGAWAGQDSFLHRGVDGLDELGVARALWVGTPYYSGWRREVLVEGSVDVPEGSVVEVDSAEALADLDGDGRSRLRVLIVGHGNDPVRYISAGLLVRRPSWLQGRRPWGVPSEMGWLPGITLVQVLVDAVNATRPTPGVFRATGHEYKADLPDAVLVAYGLDRPDDATWERLVEHLEAVDADRATRGRLPEEHVAIGP